MCVVMQYVVEVNDCVDDYDNEVVFDVDENVDVDEDDVDAGGDEEYEECEYNEKSYENVDVGDDYDDEDLDEKNNADDDDYDVDDDEE